MGSYATTTSISELIPEFLKGNTTTADSEGTSIFSRAIDRAEGVVNSALVVRWSLPFSTVPPKVRTITEDLATYFALRAVYAQDSQIQQRYLDAFNTANKDLELLRSGKAGLALTDGSLLPGNASNRYLSTTKNYDPITQRDDQYHWKRDDNEIDDTEVLRG